MFTTGTAQRRGIRASRQGTNANNTLASTAQQTDVTRVAGATRPAKRVKFSSIGDSSSSGLVIHGSSELPQNLGTDPDGATPPISGDSLRRPDFPISFSGIGVPKFTSNIRLAGIDGSVGVSENLHVAGDLTVEGTLLLPSGTGGLLSTTTDPQSASGVLNLTNATASTSPTDGALVVTGGVGIGGDTNIGGSLTINGVLVPSANILNSTKSSGLISGGEVTVASTTTIDISDGTGTIADNTTPSAATVTSISWTGLTGITITTPSNLITFVYIDIGGSVIQSLVEPTPQLRRSYILLAKIFTTDGIVINAVNNQPDVNVGPAAKLIDFFRGLGPVVMDGLRISSNGANLSIDVSAGSLHQEGVNWHADNQSPSIKAFVGQSPATLAPATQLGFEPTTTTIDPTKYDVGGVITAVPGSSSRATNIRIYMFNSGFITAQYGQDWYANISNAEAAIVTESYITEPLTMTNGILIGIISVTSGCTDLTDTSLAAFFSASKFGEISVGPGGTSTTTMQGAYNNSTQPQVIVASASGALQIQDAATPIAAELFQVLDSGGSNIFSVSDGNTACAAYDAPSATDDCNIASNVTTGTLLLGNDLAGRTSSNLGNELTGGSTTIGDTSSVFLELLHVNNTNAFHMRPTKTGDDADFMISGTTDTRIFLGWGCQTGLFSLAYDTTTGAVDIARKITTGNVTIGNSSATGDVILHGNNYTQSSWSPVIGDNFGSDFTAVNKGQYLRMGDMVYVQMDIDWSGVGTATGAIEIRGFPFTAHNVSLLDQRLSLSDIDDATFLTSGLIPHLNIIPNDDEFHIKLDTFVTSNVQTSAIVSDVGTSGKFTASGWIRIE